MKTVDLKTIELTGFNMIEASAGTGKTWTIAALYILLLLEKELLPEQILVVTYTKSATAELRDRIRNRIATTLEIFNGSRTASSDLLEQILINDRRQNPGRAALLLNRALYSFDNAAIFTIHGFCQRALIDNAFESGSLFDCEMITDQSSLVQQVCDDFWRSAIMTRSEDFIGQLVSNRITPEKLAEPFRGHYQNPDLQVVPDGLDGDLSPLLRQLEEEFKAFSSIWRKEQTEIVSLLKEAGLHQGSYSAKQIETAAGNVTNYILSAFAKADCDKLELFTSSRIESKTTKTTRYIPDHEFFKVSQRLYELKVSIDSTFQDKMMYCSQELKKWLANRLASQKKTLNQRCFDDLLLDLHLALKSEKGALLADRLRDRYKAAMIDEFQDTDPMQWGIFRQIGSKEGYPLFLIGDPKQAIYSFRGADVFAYLNAARSVSNSRQLTLNTNFRSVPKLVTAVNELFSAHKDPFLSEEIRFEKVETGRSVNDALMIDGLPDTTPLHAWIMPRSEPPKAETKTSAVKRAVNAVAGEIARLLESGCYALSVSGETDPLSPGDIAVLVKSHHQADLIQQALQKYSIPSVQQGSSTLFKTSEAMDILRILRAVAEPLSERLLREALLTRTIGFSANQIATFVDSSGNDQEWEQWLQHFHDLHAVALNGGVVAVLSRLLGFCGVRARILSRIGGERCLTNFLHCNELLHQAEQEQGKSLSASINWLERRISGDYKDDTSLLRLETDDNAVVVSTIHASKGLQYPVVFLPFAWDSPSGKNSRVMFHDQDGRLTIDLAEDDKHRQLANMENDAEAARLMYVALTRAEFRCYFVWGCINDAIDSPLFRLLHSDKIKKDKKSFSATTDDEILEHVRRLAANSGSAISACMMQEDFVGINYSGVGQRQVPFVHRTLENPPRDDWRISSFSGMLAGSTHKFQPRDHDNLVSGSAPATCEEVNPPAGDLSIFDFPKGAKAGTCLHEIFERVDFANLDNDEITAVSAAALAENGISNLWLSVVTKMIANVTSAAIITNDPDFSLSELKKGSWQSEMEFYLPLQQLAPDAIRSLFDGLIPENYFGDFLNVLENLSFRRSRGMLQGFIDLVFEHSGRYYLLDWKSNYLGHQPDDYGQARMYESMGDSAYVLQYHLYTLALDRLLRLRLPGYDYETHFGGAIYLYLRGIDKSNSYNGILHDRPPAKFIARANQLLLA